MNYLMIYHTEIKHMNRTKYLFTLLLIVLLAYTGNSQTYPPKPSPFRLVVDNAGVLSSGELQQLENKLQNFYRKSSTQIVILTIETSDGEPLSMYATEIGQRWGVGQKGQDNGIVIVAAMKDRDVFITNGYGVEEFIPDAIAKRIVEAYIVPNFKQSSYAKGFDEATTQIIGLLEGTFKAEDIKADKKTPGGRLIFFIIIIIFIVFSSFRRRGGGGFGGRSGGPIIFGGGGYSRGGGFGGGGGGSFGGGSFGGGGAGGSW